MTTLPVSLLETRLSVRRPAPWLVAGGIVGAITLALSCLVILAR